MQSSIDSKDFESDFSSQLLCRVLTIHKRKTLRLFLTRLINESPVSKNSIKIGNFDIDKNLFSFLQNQSHNFKVGKKETKVVKENLPILKERRVYRDKQLEKKICGLLNYDSNFKFNGKTDFEKSLKTCLLNHKLKKIIRQKKKSSISSSMANIIDSTNSSANYKAFSLFLRSFFNKNKLRKFDISFYKISTSSNNKEDFKRKVYALFDILMKKESNTEVCLIRETKIFSAMRYLYLKKYNEHKKEEDDQIKQLVREFDKSFNFYITLVKENRNLKKFLLFFKTINDIQTTNQTKKFNKIFIDVLKKNKERKNRLRKFAKRTGKVLNFALFKQMNKCLTILRFVKVNRTNPKSAFTLLRALINKKRTHYFRQFFYQIAPRRRNQPLHIAKTRTFTLSFTKTPKKRPKNAKLFFEKISKIFNQNKKIGFIIIKRSQIYRPKKRTKMVYGKVKALKVSKPVFMPMQSFRGSMVRGGSQDFESHSYRGNLFGSSYGRPTAYYPTQPFCRINSQQIPPRINTTNQQSLFRSEIKFLL